MDIAERAAKGAAFLDEKEPEWFEAIDLDRLDMAEGYYSRRDTTACGCVLAQTDPSGSYEVHLNRLGMITAEAIPLGFDALAFEDPYDALTEAWTAEIKARREATR